MLSGGEQQRVAVARALVMQPALLLADEPTGDLDEQTADSLHALLREMHLAYGLTSVIATHNPRLAAACDRVAAARRRPADRPRPAEPAALPRRAAIVQRRREPPTPACVRPNGVGENPFKCRIMWSSSPRPQHHLSFT